VVLFICTYFVSIVEEVLCMWSNYGLRTPILFLTGQSLLYIMEESGEQLNVVFAEVVTEPACRRGV
jgi:hypothetical protein